MSVPTYRQKLFISRFFLSSFILVMVTFLAISFSIKPSFAHHTDSPDPCYDLSGQGQQVLVNGVANSGVISFNSFAGMDHDAEACLRDPGSDGVGPFQLEGWAWDDNLGWISFYCNNGMNLGYACGGLNYNGVTVLGPESGAGAGTFRGYAWNDNAGWISFNCADLGVCATSNYVVQAETQDQDCLGSIYSGAPPAGCLARSVTTTHAWSDSVGWFDLSGVTLPWTALMQNGQLDVQLSITPDPVLALGNKNHAPAAIGVDFNDHTNYQIRLQLLDKDGNPIDPNDYENYNVTVNFNWTDTVGLNQTDTVAEDYSLNNNGAVDKPFSGSDFHLINDEGGFLVADLSSVAPTSNMNGLADSNGAIIFNYEDFLLPDAPAIVVPDNSLILNDIAVAVTRKADGYCVFGANGCQVESLPLPGGGPVTFSFRPTAQIDLLASGERFFSSQNGVGTTFTTTRECFFVDVGGFSCTSMNVHFQMGVDAPFKFVYPADGTADYNDNDFIDIDFNSVWNEFYAVPVVEQGPAPEFVSDPYIYSIISYDFLGKEVQYYSGKLPTLAGSVLLNPVADVRGDVYSTGLTNPQEGVVIRSLGDVTTNLLRDTIYRNVANITSGISSFYQPNGQTVTITGFGSSGFIANANHALYAGLPDKDNIPRVYYAKGDVYLDSGNTDLQWTGDRTIIVIGGNLHIRSNLYNQATSPKPHLGLIVLKNLQTGEGGNMYIAPNVTNIQANIFTDGSVFSYDPGAYANLQNEVYSFPQPSTDCGNGDVCYNSLGEPLFGSEDERRQILKNQLFFEGSIASFNTIGGALASPPIVGTGKLETASEGNYDAIPRGAARARLYDFNFLRYYGPVFLRDQGNAVDYDGDGSLEPTPYWEGGDLVTPLEAGLDAASAHGLTSHDVNAVYVHFDPPPSALPGFGILGGVEIKRRNQ